MRLGCFLTFLLLLGSPAHAQTDLEYPSSRPGRAAQEFFAAFAEGSDALREWISTWRDAKSLDRMSVDQRVTQFEQFRQMQGDLHPEAVASHDSYNIAIVARVGESASWVEVTFGLEQGVPFKVTSMGLQPTAPPGGPSAVLGDSEDPAELMMNARAASGSPALAVALVRDGEIVFESATGVAVAGSDQPVPSTARFHYGSVTKSFTGWLVARLIERGKLSRSDTLGELLDDMQIGEEYQQVTVGDLLRHRGGIPAYTFVDESLDRELKQLPDAPREARAAFARRFLNEPPLGTPGKSMNYSNAGFSLLAHIAERIDGRDWETQIREELFEPLGMTHAGFGWPATSARPDEPRGHYFEDDAYRPQPLDDTYVAGHYLAPSGDLHGSVGDLARYALEQLRGLRGEDGLLKSETIQALHDPGSYENANYAGGWVLEQDEAGNTIHWHNGSMGTFYAMVRLDPARNRAAVVLQNTFHPPSQSIALLLAQALMDLEP